MPDPGTVVAGRYRLLESIGEGGMGAVFRAEDSRDGNVVALKLVRADLGAHETTLARFAREARYAASIRHPHVVAVLDHGVTEEGQPFLAMEHLGGVSLSERLEELPPAGVDDVVQWMVEALAGLGAVHAAGIVHRDVKPANLFLSEEPGRTTVKLLDFGLSRNFDPEGAASLSLTQTHQFLGTPHYVSPEQVRSAREIDARSDLFSMGVILYEALAGRRPYEGPNAAAVIAAVVADDPQPLAELRPDLPADLCQVVHTALARDPDDRYQSAQAMGEALSAAARETGGLRVLPKSSSKDVPAPGERSPEPVHGRSTGRPVSASRGKTWWWLAGAAAVALAGWSGWLVTSDRTLRPVDEPVGGAILPTSDGGRAPEPVPQVFRLVGPGERWSVARAFRQLSTETRALLRFAATDAGWVLVIPQGVPENAAARAAEEIGAEPTSMAMPTAGLLEGRLLRTTLSLNLRGGPASGAQLLRTLPKGTLLVAFLGPIEGHHSEVGGTGTWVSVVATGADQGWVAARYVSSYAGCMPGLGPFLRDVPADRAAVLERDATLSRVRIRARGRVTDAFLSVARDPERERSWLGLHAVDGDCESSRAALLTVPGHVEDVLMVDTEEGGGESLVLAAWHRGATPREDGEETWSAFRLRSRVPVWEIRLRSSLWLARRRRAALMVGATRGPDGEQGFWPVRIRHPDGRREHYRWNGSTLVSSDPIAAPGTDPPDTPSALDPASGSAPNTIVSPSPEGP